MGSFGYLAPELKRGVPASPASDAYALGVLVFRLLTGVWYEADSTAGDLLAGFDPAWRAVLGKLLNDDPSIRLPMPERIELGTEGRRRRVRLVGAAMGLAALSGALVFGYLRMRAPAYTFDEFLPAEEAVEP